MRVCIVTIFIILMYVATKAHCACPYNTFTDKWSNHPEWSNQGANVVIAANTRVLFDVSTVNQVNSIIVNGELVFANKDMELKMSWMRVAKTGKLIIGSEDCPITKKIYISFYGDRTTANLIGTEPSDGGPLGAKGIAVEGESHIEIHGAVPEITWTRLDSTANKGATTITLEKTVQWKVGDVIAIANTDFHEMKSWNTLPDSTKYYEGRGKFPDQSEHRTISAISGKTITLDAPLNYTHWGQDYERAEVGLLTRNIVLRGVTDDQFGGHLLMRHATVCKISGVEFEKMGQAGILGRYPAHFHLQGDRVGDQVYAKHNSIHGCFQRCIVIHDSNGIMVQNNVAYDNLGHCYFLEEGGERENTFDHNLGMKINPIAKETGRQIVPTDNEPSMFWIANPNNTFTNNAAAGGKFGYWYIMPARPIGAADAKYKNDPNVRPRKSPLGKFDNNVAHSCFDSGLFIDDMLNMDGTTSLAGYSPRLPPYLDSNNAEIPDYSLKAIEARFTNFIGYKNRRYGVWARGSVIAFSNMILLDNLFGFNAPPGPTYVENALIVAETDNIGNAGLLSGETNRTRPYQYSTTQPIRGVESYDNGGPQYYKNITFVGYESNDARKAGGISALFGGPFAHHPRNKYIDMKFVNSNEAYIENTKIEVVGNVAFNDIDGSVVGILNNVRGGWIVSNNSLLLYKGCVPREEWNAYACPYSPKNYAQLVITNTNVAGTSYVGADGTDYNAEHKKNDETKITFYNVEDQSANYAGFGRLTSGNFQYMANVLTRNTYTVRFKYTIPTPSSLNVKLDATGNGDWAYVAIPYPPSALPFQVTATTWGSSQVTYTQVDAKDKVAKGTYFYDTASEHLYIKLENTAGVNSFTERWGFVDYSYDGVVVTIKASCGASCRPTKLNMPPPVADTDDHFKADVQSCQQLGSVSSIGSGVSFVHFNKNTRQLFLTVNHDRSSTVTKVTLEQGKKGEKGREIPITTSAMQPARTIVELSHSEWTALVKGELYVNVATSAYPNGELRGQLLCDGSCSVPPAIPDISNACTSTEPKQVIFEDEIKIGWPDYDIYMWNPNNDQKYNFTDSEEVFCGSDALRLDLHAGNVVIAHHKSYGSPGDSNYRPNPTVDTSIYDTFEFFIKSLDDRQISLSIMFENVDGTDLKNVAVTSKYIHNYKISSTAWSRVRIPLADLGFSGVQSAQNLVISHRYGAPMQTVFIDNIRFIKAGQDKMTTPLSSSAVVKYEEICKDDLIASANTRQFSIVALLASVLFLLLATL